MDNIGDWLYIVLLVIAGVSGLFGSGNKKKRPSRVPSEPESAYDPDYTYEADNTYEPQPEKRPAKSFREVVEEIASEKPASSFPSSLGRTSPVFSDAGKRSYRQTPPPPPPFLKGENAFSRQSAGSSDILGSSDEDNEGNAPDISFSDRDELKRAILISEILNRKY